MKMMKLTMMLAAACAALSALAADAGLSRVVVQEAIEKAGAAFKTASFPASEPVAVLPISEDADGWIAGQLQTALTAAGKTCVVGKDDPMWAEILKEIEWGARKTDILDPKTLTSFGKLKTARILLAAHVRFAADTARYSFVELELHAVGLETKRHLWGATVSARKYKDESKLIGLTDLPVQVRTVALNKFRDGLAASLKKKVKSGTSTAVLPFPGDSDSYAGNVIRDAVTMAGLVPVNLDATTLTEARFAVREQKQKSLGVLYGAVRDVSATLVETTPRSKIYRIDVEVQAVLEDAVSQAQLWSDTISVSDNYVQTLGWWDVLCDWFPSLRAMPWLIVVGPLGGLVLLVLVGMFLKATTRVR